MKMFSKDGIEMMDMKSLSREGDILIVKGKVMGSMTMSIYLRPEDLWQSKNLLSWSVIWYSPILFVKGFWRSWRKKRD